eukprot:6439027-Amphidinium_carterae.1
MGLWVSGSRLRGLDPELHPQVPRKTYTKTTTAKPTQNPQNKTTTLVLTDCCNKPLCQPLGHKKRKTVDYIYRNKINEM